ncbi:SLC13 family permease [Amorphus orientalis]|uniref:Di/tricarboxylate transporter n=1 Tax=Amorphus orientalis TaxID=649198 RepID=A0AAE4AUS1_9HYPH|nr:SLC13 family permease [Amorphus orientalis]MDQ0316064.1 di/tricarboxylate transporter [Amorphus orientalis]
MTLMSDLAMWLTFGVIVFSVVLYATERYSIELISLGVIVAYMIIFPVAGVGPSSLDASALIAGFANPGLLTILALLVVGQGLFHTDALDGAARIMVKAVDRVGGIAIAGAFLCIGLLSAFMNNTPVVVMFLPVIAALGTAVGRSSSRLLMPLSFISILGGMATVIGSSTNLLAVDVARRAGVADIGFFSFTPIALILIAVGAIYVLGVMPRILTPRRTMADELRAGAGRQFIAEIPVREGHPLNGAKSQAGLFPQLSEITVRLVQRGERAILPPFEDVTLRAGDIVIVAATRPKLEKILSQKNTMMPDAASDGEPEPQPLPGGVVTLAEAIVAPGSRLIGRTTPQAGFRTDTGCVALGIQRRSRMPRTPLTEIRMEAGDVLLFAGTRDQIERLRGNRDVLLVDWTATDVPRRAKAPLALAIFAAVVASAALELAPIVVAAMAGALAMLATGCLNIRQAVRVIDSRIVMLVGAAIASASALEATGGATALADAVVTALDGSSPAIILSAIFLVIAATTNVLTNNAAAVLFTPVAIQLASRLGVPAEPFVVAVIMAANCSFATPLAYQTNLLVMGPGHYRFRDFLVAGAPLVLLLWITFSLAAPWYYGLG